MATYFKRKSGWVARVRVTGHPEDTKSGFRTKEDAKAWAQTVESNLRRSRAVVGQGPTKTSLAAGLLMYAHQVTAKQAGCKQALTKINKYLVAAGLTPLRATKIAGGRKFGTGSDGEPDPNLQTVEVPLFTLAEEQPQPVFLNKQQSGFAARASKNETRHAKCQPYRTILARKPVSEFVPADFDELVNVMRRAGYGENTTRQELAILSGFFTHAMGKWNWPLLKNPALAADWPEQESRHRRLRADETERFVNALAKSTHKKFVSFVLFAIETAMRKGEALWTSCWCDLDLERSVLSLPHAKAGRRDVPLTDTALEILNGLPQGKPTDRIFGLTDNAAAAEWRRLCESAGISNLHIHDLKHISATRWAKLLRGDIFLLQQVVGNRSLSSLRVYVNPELEEAVEAVKAAGSASPATALKQAVHTERERLLSAQNREQAKSPPASEQPEEPSTVVVAREQDQELAQPVRKPRYRARSFTWRRNLPTQVRQNSSASPSQARQLTKLPKTSPRR